MRKPVRLLALAVVAVGFAACQKEPPPTPPAKTGSPAPVAAPQAGPVLRA